MKNLELERLEWGMEVLHLEMAQLEMKIKLNALAERLAELDRQQEEEDWAEMSNKLDTLIKLNEEALAN